MTAVAPMRRGLWRTVLVTVALAAVAYLAFSLWAGWDAVAAAVGRVGPLGLAAALAMSLVNYGLRFLRWQIYLARLGQAPPLWASLRIYVAGFALATTPGKAGEAVRSALLAPYGFRYASSLAALLSERLSDVTAIVILTLGAVALYPPMGLLVLAAAAIVLAAQLVIAQRRLTAWVRGWAERLATRVGDRTGRIAHGLFNVVDGARACQAPAPLAASIVLAVVAWGAEAVAFWWIVEWTGADMPALVAIFIYAASILAGAVSFLPGGLGGVEAVMTALLVWRGVPAPQALAVTIVTRLVTLWFAVALGAVALARSGATRTP